MAHWVKMRVLLIAATLQGILYAPWCVREKYMTAVAFSCISLRLKENSLCEGVGKRRKLFTSKLNARKYGHSAGNGNLGHFPHQMRMKFVVSDAFRVKIGCEDLFEQAWRERQGKLEGVKGFQKFILLKKCEHQKYKKQSTLESTTSTSQPQPPEYVGYLGQSFWAHELDFSSYIESDCAAQQRLPPGLSSFLVNEEQSKDPTSYETVFSDPILPEDIGGFWDFEENLEYFDGDIP